MDKNWLDTLTESIKNTLGDTKTERIMIDKDSFTSFSETERANWCAGMAQRLDAETDDKNVKMEIMSRCSCSCYDEHISYLKRIYSDSENIDVLLAAMYETVFKVQPVREDNRILITKAPAHPVEYVEAKSAAEKKYHYCHCDNVRSYDKIISPTYCYCGAGWCKNIWEEVLGRPVQVEITKTVLSGDDMCQFEITI